MLPLVSKRWAQLLGAPSAAWQNVVIDMTDPELSGADGFRSMGAWFRARSGSVAWLRVPYCEQLHMLPREVALHILMTQSASLRGVNLHISAVALSGSDMRVLLGLSALEDLNIQFHMDCAAGWDDHAAALIKTVCLLPALKRVELCAEEGDGWLQELPTLAELRSLRSASLTSMTWSVSGTGGTLKLGALPALCSCSLTWWSDNSKNYALEVSAGSFRGTPALTALSLCGDHSDASDVYQPGVRLIMDLECFSSFSALESLSLLYCALTGVPPALHGVRRTLRFLDLSENPLQVDNAGLDTLLTLSSLEEVEIEESEGETTLLPCPTPLSSLHASCHSSAHPFTIGMCTTKQSHAPPFYVFPGFGFFPCDLEGFRVFMRPSNVPAPTHQAQRRAVYP